MKKQFVVFHNAVREHMWSDRYTCKASKEVYNYREGELGLINSQIDSYFKNDFSKVKCYICRPYWESLALYKKEADDSHILIFDKEYLIVPLKKDEFQILEESGLNRALKEDFYKERYKHLKAFDILSPKISKIPIEVALKKVSDEQIKQEEKHLENMAKLRDAERKNWARAREIIYR
jgi:hypothetical protein